jgi:hypothetical protein
MEILSWRHALQWEFLPLSLLPFCHEASSFFSHIVATVIFYLTTGWEAIGPSDHGLKLLNY